MSNIISLIDQMQLSCAIHDPPSPFPDPHMTKKMNEKNNFVFMSSIEPKNPLKKLIADIKMGRRKVGLD